MTELQEKAMRMALEALENLRFANAPFLDEAMEALRQAQPEQEPKWIDSIKSGDRVLYDGDGATVFSVLRQRPLAPDYFKLDFDDGSYIDISDNDLIANGKQLYTAPPKQPEQYDQTALELCNVCGWKAIIPDEGCLVCARKNQEPVAWMYEWLDEYNCWNKTAHLHKPNGSDVRNLQPLYTAPPKREWVGLTDVELPEGATYEFDRGVRWAEAKLKEKNT